MSISLEFGLRHWCLWHTGDVETPPTWPNGTILTGDPDVGFMPMMQRRRLSPLAKAACAVAWECRQATGDMPTIYYSAHGESHYYFDMLQNMAAGESLSPSRFSLSVHNAIAGIFSLHSGSRMPYVSLAGGNDGIFAAFLEAAGLLQEVPAILLVCYEQPLPQPYQAYLAHTDQTWALAMVLSKSEQVELKLQFWREVSMPASASKYTDNDFIQTILENRDSAELSRHNAIWGVQLRASN